MRSLAVILVALAFCGCSLRPDMPEINGEFTYEYGKYDIADKWWENFNDAKLNELIQTALENNSNLLVALNNIEKAKINLGLAKIDFLPNVNLQGSATRTRTSGELPTYPDNVKYNSFSLGAALSWEIDLWGKIANSVRANKATFRASEFDFANSRLSVASSVAKTYFTLIALSEQEKILKDSLNSYEQTLDYRQKQLNSGAISDLVYEQSSVSVSSARVQLANTQDQISQTKTALLILVGAKAKDILTPEFTSSDILPEAPLVPNGVSSDILLHRPDVAAALETLKAANARIGVARAGFLPSLSLTGLFGFASDELDRFLIDNAATWNVGGSLLMPLLDFGRTSKKVDLAKLDENSSLINYDATLKNAFGEIRNALDARKHAVISLDAAKNLVNSQEKVFELSKIRYDEGYATHLDFLDAQRLLLNAKISLSNAKLNSLNNAVEIYKVLGGGFTSQEK